MLRYILIFILCSPVSVQAGELYLTGGLGAMIATNGPSDGLWYQEAFPHQFSMTDLAYKGGAGYRFTDAWSMEVNYVNLGATGSSAAFVFDQHYDAQAHVCTGSCDQPHTLRVKDQMWGFEMTIARTWHLDPFRAYLKAGGAMLWHQNTVTWRPYGGQMDGTFTMAGTMPSFVGGGGVCWLWLCGDVAVYQVVAHSGNPIARQMLVPMMIVQLPLSVTLLTKE